MLTCKTEIEENQQKRADSLTVLFCGHSQFWSGPLGWWPWLLSNALKILSCDYRQWKKKKKEK